MYIHVLGVGTIHQVQNLAGDKLCLHSPRVLISHHRTATHVHDGVCLLTRYVHSISSFMKHLWRKMVSLIVTLAHHSCIVIVFTSEPQLSWTVCQPFLSSSALDLLTAKILRTRTLAKPCPLGNHGNYIETNSR